ncbi:hypothetical protein [Mammaliicoccus sciuri]|uniref:hypothetical protein n=1 Tax=Mammaliicoccus sciuri TaxID=1296 RepID=UPI001E3C14B5|nr:hypothetical protein [Mammaliicoccus sciuri]MCD8898178.1 hypothetical protein [Mammaliicoccus sciuri]
MNNDRGQSLQIPQKTTLTAGHVYMATLHSVSEVSFSGEIKHQFVYEVVLKQQTFHVKRSISIDAIDKQLSISEWLKRHSNYNVKHINYEPYIDQQHLILVGEYSDSYYVEDIAPLNKFGGILK